jgi:hypothetical protein
MFLEHVGQARFKAMYGSNVTLQYIADECGVSVPTVIRAARSLGLPGRRVNGIRVKPGQAVATPEASGRPCPKVGGSAFWTPARDRMIWDTGGRHEGIAELAGRWGATIQSVTARWHRLRVA